VIQTILGWGLAGVRVHFDTRLRLSRDQGEFRLRLSGARVDFDTRLRASARWSE
jgi:hypothetical protein